jgi:hypothetical protein
MLLQNSSHHCWCGKLNYVLFQVLHQKWQCRMPYSIFRCHSYELCLEDWEMLLDFLKYRRLSTVALQKKEKKMDINFLLTWKRDRLPCDLLNVFSSSRTIPTALYLQTFFICAGYVLWDAYLSMEQHNQKGPHFIWSCWIQKQGMNGWGEPTRTLVSWRQGFRHPTRNECMGWFAQIGINIICYWMFSQHLPCLVCC